MRVKIDDIIHKIRTTCVRADCTHQHLVYVLREIRRKFDSISNIRAHTMCIYKYFYICIYLYMLSCGASFICVMRVKRVSARRGAKEGISIRTGRQYHRIYISTAHAVWIAAGPVRHVLDPWFQEGKNAKKNRMIYVGVVLPKLNAYTI